MNDRYLFRGKRTDNMEWVIGYYFYTEGDDKHWIWKCGEFKREIDPATRGQCTGLKDKNGKFIFEGDIIQMFNHTMKVEYYKGAFGYWTKWEFIALQANPNCLWKDEFTVSSAEIIGNINDYSELLEVQND